MRFLKLLALVICPLLCFSQSLPDNIDISISSNGVVPFPGGQASVFNSFVKYTKIQAPNGQAIHFMAQNAITDAQIVRARNILQFYLTNVPGSQYGSNKTAVINQMGTNDAMIMLLNGSDGSSNPPNLGAQTLYQNEMAVEGHSWYINNDYNHRDAAYEEILHLMHDTGIGVDGPNSFPGALPAYQAEIRSAQQNASSNNYQIWPLGASSDPSWYNELNAENSLTQEYLAGVIDSYYGLWGAWTGSTQHGMWGEYISKTRGEIPTEDPMGQALLPKFFSPIININMDIDPSFSGTFDMTYSAGKPYTHKSQYLQHITLTGSNSSSISANNLDNRLNGNDANNSFTGLMGNDYIDGKGGDDTAIFSGDYTMYTVVKDGMATIVQDMTANRDGIDTLHNIEFMQFADQTVATSSILPVRWGHFSAKPKEEEIAIEWSTWVEINAKEFDVQKADGKGSWRTLVTIPCVGNSTSTNIYRYVDKDPFFGINRYRIQQIDRDGHSTFSDDIVCKFHGEGLFLEFYPNPTKDVLYIKVNDEYPVNIDIFNQSGNKVESLVVDNNTSLTTSSWMAGTYYLRYNFNQHYKTLVIVKQ